MQPPAAAAAAGKKKQQAPSKKKAAAAEAAAAAASAGASAGGQALDRTEYPGSMYLLAHVLRPGSRLTAGYFTLLPVEPKQTQGGAAHYKELQTAVHAHLDRTVV